ncbi:MAG: phosphohistidine phosphatase [Verrucomicrobiales bacterium]|nr:phosphohistidine phosphatase [Verrucomicrobiales bacterium]
MKTLTIVRHAKSSWDNHSLNDHDRPLNDRGFRAAPLVGKALKERDVSPDVILSSTALRAWTTAKIIAGEIGYPEEKIITTEEIYLASTRTLLNLLTREIDEAHESAMIFGHNPGFHDLTNTLLEDEYVESFPTCAVARIRLPIDHWGEISGGEGELVEHFTPKSLKSG